MNESREHLLSTSSLFTVLPGHVQSTGEYPGPCGRAFFLLSGRARPVLQLEENCFPSPFAFSCLYMAFSMFFHQSDPYCGH